MVSSRLQGPTQWQAPIPAASSGAGGTIRSRLTSNLTAKGASLRRVISSIELAHRHYAAIERAAASLPLL
jgi:hypothetical protein